MAMRQQNGRTHDRAHVSREAKERLTDAEHEEQGAEAPGEGALDRLEHGAKHVHTVEEAEDLQGPQRAQNDPRVAHVRVGFVEERRADADGDDGDVENKLDELTGAPEPGAVPRAVEHE